MLTPVKVRTEQDATDLFYAVPQDLSDFRELGKRINRGNSAVINDLLGQSYYAPWYVELAKAWATVDDMTVFKAMMEEWSPEACGEYLGLELEISAD
jgi:hypothetical protein